MEGEFSLVLDRLRAEARQHRRRTQGLRWIVGTILCLTLASTLYLVLIGRYTGQDLLMAIPTLALMGGISMAYTPRHKSLLSELTAKKNPLILNHLLLAARHTEADVRNMAEAALPEILGIWLSQERSELSGEARANLYGLLDIRRPKGLVQAVLIAIHSIGGPESLEALDRFRSSAQKTSTSSWAALITKSLNVSADVRLRSARTIIQEGTREASEDQQVRT